MFEIEQRRISALTFGAAARGEPILFRCHADGFPRRANSIRALEHKQTVESGSRAGFHSYMSMIIACEEGPF